MQSGSRQGKQDGSVRIVGGKWRRTPLCVLDETGLRPTPGRVRETLFNWLAHAFGGLEGRSALDLFAGSGALGFEAASRGADPVVLVDANERVVDALRGIRTKLSASAVEVISGDGVRIATQLQRTGRRFDVVFLDPPFGDDLLASLLPVAASLCHATGLIYVECDQRVDDAALSDLGLLTYRADRAGAVFYHLLQRKKID